MSERKRAWIYVENNPPESALDEFKTHWQAMGLRYGKFALEVGENGTRHIQGYLYFTNAKSFTAVKKLYPKAHLEVRRGTHDEARDYVGMKDKGGSVLEIVEVGIDLNQGGRSDLLTANEAYHSILEDIKNGATEKELWSNYAPYMFRHLTNIRECLKFHMRTASVAEHYEKTAKQLQTSAPYVLAARQEDMPFMTDADLKDSARFTSPWGFDDEPFTSVDS